MAGAAVVVAAHASIRINILAIFCVSASSNRNSSHDMELHGGD